MDFVRSLGAETVVDYTAIPFEEVVRDVELVLDAVGGETLERSWPVVKRGGTLISIVNQPSQEKAQELGVRALFGGGPATDALLKTIARLIDEGHITATIQQLFSLRDVRQAHVLCQAGHGRGRIVLHIAD